MTNAAIHSPAMLTLFITVFLCMIIDVHFLALTSVQKWVASLVVLFLAVFNETLSALFGIAMLRKIFLLTIYLPFFLLFLYLTKYGWLKMTFIIFSVMIFAAFPTMIIRFIDHAFPIESWTAYLCDAVCYLAMLLLVWFIFRRSFNYILKYGDNKIFIPLLLSGIFFYIYVFAVWNLNLLESSAVGTALVRYMPAMQVFMFYFSLVRSYQNLNEKRELETAQTALGRELDAVKEQLALLDEAQIQSVVYRHDLRHHLAAVNGFLADGDLHQAEAYIEKVCGDIEAVTPRRFCENRLVDLLCSSYANRAEQRGIRLTVEIGLPEAVSLSDTEMCAMISNGLENALNAAGELDESRRWVEFYCGVWLDKLLIEIKNPYAGRILCQDGLPISNRVGHGYGCHSIRTIAERKRGICVFKPEDGIFTLRIVIPM